MARPIRNCIPGVPHHVLQRGNNRRDCFRSRRDYLDYLGLAAKAANRYGVSIHAYVLMTNHVHLLVTGDQEDAISSMMQFLSGQYARKFNFAYDCSGSVWEGRFKSFPISHERYLFACYRYVELNPVRAGMVTKPDQYPWSSFRANALGSPNILIEPTEAWISLGRNLKDRCEAYQRLFLTPLDDITLVEIRESIRLGSDPGSDPKCDYR